MKRCRAKVETPKKQILTAVCRTAASSVVLAASTLWTAFGAPAEPGPIPIAPANPGLVKLPFSFPTGMENTPGRLQQPAVAGR